MTLGIITIQYTYMILYDYHYDILYDTVILFKSKQSLGEYRNPERGIPFSFAKPGAWEVLRSRRALWRKARRDQHPGLMMQTKMERF